MSMLYYLVVYSMFTVTPVGDSCLTKLFRYFMWWTILCNTPYYWYIRYTFIGVPLLLFLISGICFWINLLLFPFSGLDFEDFLLNPFNPIISNITLFHEQAGKKKLLKPRNVPLGDLKAKNKRKERCQNVQKARDRKYSVLDEQAGISLVDWDPYIRELTLLETLRRILMSVSDKSGLIAALVMYAQSHSNKSFVSHLSGLTRRASTDEDRADELFRFFDDSLFEQSGNLDSSWITDLRSCLNNWKRYRTSKVAKSFLNLVNYVVSVGLCDKAKLTFSIGNVTLFTPFVSKRQLVANDLCELIMETALGFIEGGWRAFSNKSISAFFVEEDLFVEFENMYNDIRSIHGFSLTGNLRKFAGIDENEYELKLDAALKIGGKMLLKLGSESSFERKFISDRMDKIHDYRNEFVQVRTRGGLRIAPFGVSLYGDSAVGKSTLNQLTYEAIGSYNKIDVTPERVATWADNDKFASNIRASTNVIIFDDFGNTAPNFMDFSPCYRLIQCVNNALFTAPMAEANLKGKVGLHPHIVTITTNVEYLSANIYSEKPESILRRFYHVKVEIKDEFNKDGKLDETKVFAKFGYTKIPDVWKLTVRSCVVGGLVASGSDRRQYSLEPIMFEGEKMIHVDVRTYLRWVQLASHKHYDQQRNLVEVMRKEQDMVCHECGFFGCACDAVCEDSTDIPLVIDEVIMEEHVGICRSIIKCSVRILFLICQYFLGYSYGVFINWCVRWRLGLIVPPLHTYWLESMDEHLRMFYAYFDHLVYVIRSMYVSLSTEGIIRLHDFYENHWLFDFVVYLPDRYVNSNIFILGLMYQRRMTIAQRQYLIIIGVILCYLKFLCLLYMGCIFKAIVIFIICNFALAIVLLCERMVLKQELMNRRSVVPATVRWLRNHYLLAAGSLISTFYIALKLWKKARVLEMQGNLTPQTMEDVEERDLETNPWAELVISPVPMTIASKTTTTEDLIPVVARNIVNIESERYIVKGFFLTSNVLVVPYHYLRIHRENGFNGDIRIRCFRTDRNKVGGNFREVLSEEYSYRIPNSDFIAFYSPSSGSVADITKFLPPGLPTTSDARFIVKETNCSITVHSILFEAQRVEHTSLSFDGGRYKLPIESYQGLCMTPIVSKGRGSTILGFHLCGKGKIGGAGTITNEQARLAILSLSAIEGCIIPSANGEFPKEQYGFQTISDVVVHKKSATRFISPDNSLEVYGTITGMATPYSSVRDTLISNIVTEVTGVVQQWGPPKMFGKGTYPYQAALETLAHPSLSLGSFVRPAVICYRSVFVPICRSIPGLFEQAKPLSDVETVSGIDGRRFIDAMNMKTSPGWPLSGRKDKWIIDLDPADYPGISRPRTFVPEIWNEVDRCTNIMLNGERPYFIWKACLKDEPTKLTKTKVRVFQSAPIALQLIIRKYFLPIVRIIQCNPLDAECLVGANAEGPEWEQMNDFMLSKGPNVLAGDYSKYDQRMPAQLVIAAFDVLIWIAQELCGYPHTALLIMRGVVGEVAFPLMAYNGDLLQIFGSNPSGQNLTVVINSIANSLLLRSCYYSLYPRDAEHNLFRKYCAMATYGDDVKGTVSNDRPLFNHLSYAHFLKDFDIVFTMPDKESIATRYMNADEADFLKRTNRYHKDLAINVGVLSEASIFKRLHSHLVSKDLSLEMQSAVNIDTSLHDWFYYGYETFMYRRSQLLEIAVRSNIVHLCRGFDLSYEARVLRWNQKYRSNQNYEDSISDISDYGSIDLSGLDAGAMGTD